MLFRTLEGFAAKGYWVSAYRTIPDPVKLAAYNQLAGPAAVAAHESEAYQEALAALSDGAERDFRIIEGLD